MDIALSLGADFVATGHYCQKDTITKDGKPIYRLLSGQDASKDQSYFLCQLTQQQLAKTLFPIGHLQKSEVRKIAAAQALVTAEKKDSQGLCFIGKVRLPDFLKQQLAPKQGPIISIPVTQVPQLEPQDAPGEAQWKALATRKQYQPEEGTVVGTHEGAHYFTIGQRKGLAVGGTAAPLFVIATDTAKNIIYVGEGAQHPGLFHKALFVAVDQLHWVREDQQLQIGEHTTVMARIRYRQPLQAATLERTTDGLYVIFDQPQSAITPGQFVAWYRENELLGSGVIA